MITKQKDFVLDEIVEIEDMGYQQTYDFTIPTTHCFVANKILVHNSLEEHADTVMLLYWPSNNERHCEDRNKFEILIEKQRHGPIGWVEVDFIPEFFKFNDKSISVPPTFIEQSAGDD